jgi:hypothetical protein
MRPYAPSLHEVAQVNQITFGNNGEYNVHVSSRGKDETYPLSQARELFPRNLAYFILKNDLVILKDFAWASRYNKISYSCKTPGQFGVKWSKKLSRHRLFRCMNMAARKHRNKLSKHTIPYPAETALEGELYLNGKPITMDQLDEIIDKYQEQDQEHHRIANMNPSVQIHKQEVALIDSACDTCAIGGTAWIIDEHTGRLVDICGHTQNSTMRSGIPIVTATTAVELPSGETVLLKVHEASNLGQQGNSLLSTVQLREHGVEVMDIPKRHGGQPYIMADGYVIPLQLEIGLMKINIRLPTEQELHTCTEIELTSDLP